MVIGEIDKLQQWRHCGDVRRNVAGKRVGAQIEEQEIRGKRKRDRAVEGVEPEAEPAEVPEVGNAVGEWAGEGKAGETEVGDVAGGGAGDATPVAWGPRGGWVPPGEGVEGVVEVEFEGG